VVIVRIFFNKGEIRLSGNIIVGIGIGFVVLSVILLIYGVVYKGTTGKKIREQLEKEY